MKKKNTMTFRAASAMMAAVMSLTAFGGIVANAGEYAPEQEAETAIVMEANANGEYEVVAGITDIAAFADMGLTKMPEAAVPTAALNTAAAATTSANNNAKPKTKTEYYQAGDGRIVVVTKELRDGVDTFNVTADTEAKYYPGAIITARGIDENNAGVITTLGRNTCKMTVGLEMEDGYSNSIEYDPSNVSSYDAALRTLLAHAKTDDKPAGFLMNSTYATSAEDIKASLDVSAKVIDKLNIKFNSIMQGNCQTCVVSYYQKDFVVKVDTQTGDQPFTDPAAAHAVMDNRDADDEVAMINTATYGKRVLVAYTTNDTSFDLQAALEAKYKGIEGNATFDYSKKLSNVTCSIYVDGGSNNAAGSLYDAETNKTYADVMKKLEEIGANNDFTKSSYLSYSAISLKDNARTIAINNAGTKYTTSISYKEQIPLEFSTAERSVNGRVDDFHVNLSYDIVVPADSPAADAARRNDPNSVTTESEDLVRIHMTDYSKITVSDTKNTINIPASVDISTINVAVGYNGWCASSNHDNFVSYNLRKYAGNKSVAKVEVKCDAGTKGWGGYWTRGEIYVNGTRVTMAEA